VIDGWLQVPVGRRSTDWLTARPERTVIAVVHTVAGLGHLVDALELLEVDPRIQVVFTQAPDLFNNGVARMLDGLDTVVVPWRQAMATPFDLAIVSDTAGVHELDAPVLLVPHGVMNNKLAPAALAGVDNELVVGMAAAWLTRFGRLVPAAMALSHDELLAVLHRQCPEALTVARVVGDLCLDRLNASHGTRKHYRQRLGIGQEQVLVALSSTWGPNSLFGRWQRHVYELAAQLPPEHVAVAVMHPALWYGHGPRQVKAWLREACRGGLRIVEPLDWRALVVASDVLIGDHGSVTVYAAATGVPVLQIDDAPEAVKGGSAGSLLARSAMKLAIDRPLTEQLTEVMEGYEPSRHEAIRRRVTSRPEQAASLLRSLMYRLLDLEEPPGAVCADPVSLPMVRGERASDG
jgi:hypothetical protein